MTNLAHNATLYANCSLAEARALPVSVADEFFTGQAFNNWKKSRENDVTIQLAVVDRLNRVISTMGNFMKALARR